MISLVGIVGEERGILHLQELEVIITILYHTEWFVQLERNAQCHMPRFLWQAYAVGAEKCTSASGFRCRSRKSALLYPAFMKLCESTLSAFILFTYASLETASASRNMILNRLPRVTWISLLWI